MALALSTAGSERGDGSVYGGSQYGGSVRGRANTARPQSSYMGSEFGFNGGSGSSVRAESRVRSKSLAEPKNYNSQGRLILNYCKLFVPLFLFFLFPFFGKGASCKRCGKDFVLTITQLVPCTRMQPRFQRNSDSKRVISWLYSVCRMMGGGRLKQSASRADRGSYRPTICNHAR